MEKRRKQVAPLGAVPQEVEMLGVVLLEALRGVPEVAIQIMSP